MYRTPICTRGVYSALSQYNQADRKVKNVMKYHKELLTKIKEYIATQNYVNNILIAKDFNQFIGSNEIQGFYNEIRVQDIHHIINQVPFKAIDKTYSRSSKSIDSIAALTELMN